MSEAQIIQVEGTLQGIIHFSWDSASFDIQGWRVDINAYALEDRGAQEFRKLQDGAYVQVEGTVLDDQDLSIRATRLRVLQPSVMVATPSEELNDTSQSLVQQLCAAGYHTALHLCTVELGKQMWLASIRDIPVMVIPQDEDTVAIQRPGVNRPKIIPTEKVVEEIRRSQHQYMLNSPLDAIPSSSSPGCLMHVAETAADRRREESRHPNWRYRKTT